MMALKAIDAVDLLAGRNVLVTGSSGFIGTKLCRRLADLGAIVTGVDLRDPREQIKGLNFIRGDVRKLSSVNIPPPESIFNLAAVHTTPGHPDHEYYDTNVLGALEVTKVAERDAVRDVMFTSSISIYGPSEDRKMEDSVPAPNSAYGKSKWIAEEIHRGWLRGGAERRLTIVRPAVVFGEGERGNFDRLAKLLRGGIFIFPGRRDTIKSCIYVEDLIDLIFYAVCRNDRYVLANGSYAECPSLETIVKVLRDGYFPYAKFFDIPAPFVLTAAKVLSVFSGLGLGIHPDRVIKLIRSTNVYPGWAVEHQALTHTSLENGINRWAVATGGRFDAF